MAAPASAIETSTTYGIWLDDDPILTLMETVNRLAENTIREFDGGIQLFKRTFTAKEANTLLDAIERCKELRFNLQKKNLFRLNLLQGVMMRSISPVFEKRKSTWALLPSPDELDQKEKSLTNLSILLHPRFISPLKPNSEALGRHVVSIQRKLQLLCKYNVYPTNYVELNAECSLPTLYKRLKRSKQNPCMIGLRRDLTRDIVLAGLFVSFKDAQDQKAVAKVLKDTLQKALDTPPEIGLTHLTRVLRILKRNPYFVKYANRGEMALEIREVLSKLAIRYPSALIETILHQLEPSIKIKSKCGCFG
ncbi:MAG: hypothetical protein SP1CHLAM54_00660 [Chlamydiia bacterium]|nr:hypothetical protein [Chlamydiia bacterium]MCH9614988.1 hypothetical protein [Chlamydiia bacterium]MCH9629962.1 hypothetical protein [Chlamydiia bacterium]